MKICIDDGSTNIKMQWTEGKAAKRHISPTTFKREWSAGDERQVAFNYQLGRQRYSFDNISRRAERTTEVLYQYDDLNVVAVHHALHTSGLEPQPLDIVVTLPISEFYKPDLQLNSENIQRKKDNLQRDIVTMRRAPFTINSVEVLPESLPAAFELLNAIDATDSLLIVDLGGTTLDVAQARGQMKGIVQIYGAENVGVSLVTQAVQNALVALDSPASAAAANRIIEKRHDADYIDGRLNRENSVEIIQNVIEQSRLELVEQVKHVLKRFSDYTHVMIIGGGAELVADELREFCQVRRDRFFKTDHSQFDLVDGLYRIYK